MSLVTHSLPELEPHPPRSGERLVACLVGDVLFAVHGGGLGSTTVLRFDADGAVASRTFPASDTHARLREVREAHRGAGFRALGDATRLAMTTAVTAAPYQLVACDGRLWLVRSVGHAEIDVETLEIRPVAHSAARRIWDLGGGQALVGGGAHYSGLEACKVLTRVDARTLDEAPLRSPTQLIQNGDFTITGARLDYFSYRPDSPVSSTGPFAIIDGVATGGRIVHFGLAFHRSSTSDGAFTSFDLASNTLTAHTPTGGKDGFVPVATRLGLIGFGKREIVRLDRERLDIVDRCRAPTGMALVGHDETRLVLHASRANALVVVDSSVLDGELATAVERLKATLGDATRPSKGSRSSGAGTSASVAKAKKGVREDPDALTVLAHAGALRKDLFDDDRAYVETHAAQTPLPSGIVSVAVGASRRGLRCDPDGWCRLADRALDLSARYYEQPGAIDYRAGPDLFGDMLALSVVRGRADIRARLLAIDPSVFESQGLPHARALARALAAILAGDADAATRDLDLARRSAAARASAARGTDAAYHSMLTAPKIHAFAQVLSGDQAAADAALAEAFRQHRAFWGRDRGLNRGDRPLRENERGFAPYRLAGLMALARERGMALEVRSEYAPAWMFATGSCP